MNSRPSVTPTPRVETSQRKIMLIGPEGSGKTVLAAVLADFVANNPQYGLHLRNDHYGTKQYCFKVLEAIRAGDWPPSTRPGAGMELQWEWGIREHDGEVRWRQVKLLDPPGQDVRLEMTGRESASGIARQIDESRILVVVLDLEGYYASPPAQKCQTEWILESALLSFSRQIDAKRLIVVVTKADGLVSADLLSEDGWSNRAAVVGLIRDRMPTCNIQSYSTELAHPNCAVLAVAAAKVICRSTADGVSRLVPSQPHRSRGLPLLVDKLVEALRAEHDGERTVRAAIARIDMHVEQLWRHVNHVAPRLIRRLSQISHRKPT